MNKEELKKLADDPKFIRGVYTYCDRWCERCPATSRCLNFAIGEEHYCDPETRDINNKAFWQKLHEMNQLTLDLVKEWAEREGLDLESLDIEGAAEEEERVRDYAHSHELSLAARAYGKMVDEFLDCAQTLFEAKEEELNLEAQLELPNAYPEKEATGIVDAVEVIRWYQHQIYIKLKRALSGILDERELDLDEFPKDSDGSAKVALIGIDRSMAAWGEMLKHFNEQEDTILAMLAQLERLRRRTEEVFSSARAFVRPWFDETHGKQY